MEITQGATVVLEGSQGLLQQLNHDRIDGCKLFAVTFLDALDVGIEGTLNDGKPLLLTGVIVQPLGITHHRPASSLSNAITNKKKNTRVNF